MHAFTFVPMGTNDTVITQQKEKHKRKKSELNEMIMIMGKEKIDNQSINQLIDWLCLILLMMIGYTTCQLVNEKKNFSNERKKLSSSSSSS